MVDVEMNFMLNYIDGSVTSKYISNEVAYEAIPQVENKDHSP